MSMTIRNKIRAAKTVHVLLHPDYYRHGNPDVAPMIRVSVAMALRIVDMSPKNNPPHGAINADGILILHPPYGDAS